MSDKFFNRVMIAMAIIFCLEMGFLMGAAVMKAKQKADTPAYSVYDLDQNGLVNSTDASICYDIFTGFRVATPAMLERADVDFSGIIDDADCTLIMDAVLGKVE